VTAGDITFASLFVSDATGGLARELLLVDASKYRFVDASKFLSLGRISTMTAAQKIDRHGNRRYPDEIHNFTASPELAADLQRVLVDLVELHLQGKQAHWNVLGSNFRDLHLQLDELVDAARDASDTIAERMRALDAVPDGRSDTVAATTSLPQFPANEVNTGDVVDLVTARTYATVDTIRDVHDAVDAVDPSTSDLLHQVIDSLEKLAWMIKSENRKI
jgi:starvation-inducible DNA-binding protein